jgi:amino acid adenylation domain-containing protein
MKQDQIEQVTSTISTPPALGTSPMSLQQQRLWLLQQLERARAAFNLPCFLRLRGKLDRLALERSVELVTAQHQILSCRFIAVEDELLQAQTGGEKITVNFVDLSPMPEPEREDRLLLLASQEQSTPFPIASAPPLRATLLRVNRYDHALLLTAHRIVCDSISGTVLLRAIAEHYNASVSGGKNTCKSQALQYAEYVSWQNEYLRSDDSLADLHFWKHQLEGIAPGIELPADYSRPPEPSFIGGRQALSISGLLRDGLLQLSRDEGVEPSLVLLTALIILLLRYSGQEEVVIGIEMPGRTVAGTENSVGPFANDLVLRVDVRGNPSIREVLARVRKAYSAANAHQDLPFAKLVESVRLERDLSRNPLFQVKFVSDSFSELPVFHGLEATQLVVDTATETHDLTVHIRESRRDLEVNFSYSTDLFAAATIERMIGHLQTILVGVVADSTRTVANLPLLTETEERQILLEWNGKQQGSSPKIITEFIEAQAARTPDNTALIFDEERFTYADLNARANQLAHYLKKMGVGPEVLVAICTERTHNLLVGIVAILKAGGAYVPLDPAYPRERIEFILNHAKAHVLLTQESLRDSLPRQIGHVLSIDAAWSEIAKESTKNPTKTANPLNLAYVIYTSGSTGQPKGVAIEHRSTSAFLDWAKTVFSPQDLAGVLFSTSICFDLSIFEMFAPLGVGGTVILAQNALQLSSLPAKNEVTLINTVPSAMSELVPSDAVPASVRIVNLAGEALPRALVEQIYAQTKVQKVFNLYGPTEDTTYSTYALVGPGEEVTIGRPIHNTQAYVLDRELRLMPVGVPGELYLAGEGLARGYFGRADLTAERFLPNPFARESGSRMYKTGDSVRYLLDGNLEYLGRLDHQVKIRGFRIEIGEIEATLSQHPAVASCVVVARENGASGKRLVAYFVPRQGETVVTSDLRLHLKRTLPEYMIPSLFVSLPALPLTSNGKVDRRALPLPEASPELGRSVPPRTELEEKLVDAFATVLGIPSVGATDDFFELGGHSLTAARLLSKIEQATGVEIPLRLLFKGATPEYLAQVVEKGVESLPEPVVTVVQPGTSSPAFFAVVPPGENAIGYVKLARYTGSRHPFYKLQGPGRVLVGRPYTWAEMRTLAHEYVAAMRSVQPEGPYYFGGMCDGAHLAVRMAERLEQLGEEVGMLAVFDTWVLEHSQRRWAWGLYYYSQRFSEWTRLGFREQLHVMRKAGERFLNRLRGKRDSTIGWADAYWPDKEYVPPTFGGRVTLFKRPKQPFYYKRDATMGWGMRARGGVTEEILPLRHAAMLREPSVQILAKRLAECLHRTQVANSQGTREEHAGIVEMGLPPNSPGEAL